MELHTRLFGNRPPHQHQWDLVVLDNPRMRYDWLKAPVCNVSGHQEENWHHTGLHTGSVPAFFLTQNLKKKGRKWSPFGGNFTDPKNGIKMMFSLLTFHARQSLSKRKSFK